MAAGTQAAWAQPQPEPACGGGTWDRESSPRHESGLHLVNADRQQFGARLLDFTRLDKTKLADLQFIYIVFICMDIISY